MATRHRGVKVLTARARIRCPPYCTPGLSMHTEGRYTLDAAVTPTAGKPGRWTAAGILRLPDSDVPVETVLAGDSFETPQVAEVAAIEAARQVAMTRGPDADDATRPR